MRFKQRRQGEILKRQRHSLVMLLWSINIFGETGSVACEACDFCGDCFRFFCGHRRSSEYDRADTHSVHVQDLYMYTYAQYCCQTSLKLSKLHETAGITDNCKETFLFFSAGSIGTLACHSQMQLRGGFLALKNTILSKASGAAPWTPHGGSAPLTPLGDTPRPPICPSPGESHSW